MESEGAYLAGERFLNGARTNPRASFHHHLNARIASESFTEPKAGCFYGAGTGNPAMRSLQGGQENQTYD